jgi:GT2 family glycosyltransferase
MKTVALVVLNYNGISHLKHLLPTLEEAIINGGGCANIIVLDNRSTDSDCEWVAANYSKVQVISAPTNDFLFSYNWLLPKLEHDVVVLLNNDLRVHGGFLTPLLRHFSATDVFAASARSYTWDGTEITSGPARLTRKNGFYGWRYDTKRQKTCHTLFPAGGFMAVDRRKFLELRGFNPLFYPAYCEDVDLGFRAWRRGWRCIYEPDSIVWHRQNATWSMTAAGQLNELVLRNSLLFQWSSLPMGRDRWTRRWTLAKLLLGGSIWAKTFPKVLLYWFRVRKQYSWMKVTDTELASIVSRLE